VFEQIEPLIEVGGELVEGFGEFGEFDVDEFEFVVEDLAVLVFELDDVEQLALVFMVVEDKVEDADGVDGAEFVVPFAFERLFLDREGGVVDAAVFEEVLFGFLDFDDEAFAADGLAVDVEDGFAIDGGAAELFGIAEGEFCDLMVGGEEGVEEVDEEVFVGFRAKDPLEAEVGQEADVSVLEGIDHGDRWGTVFCLDYRRRSGCCG
jgi:hypothetical protein